MTPEQMMAWLQLEGWELCKDKSPRPLIRRGEQRIWCTDYYEETMEDRVENMDHTYINSEFPVAYTQVDPAKLKLLYEAVANGGHDDS